MSHGHRRPSLPRARGVRPLLRSVLAAAAALVAAFHGWLLLQRLVDASIGDPDVLLRWLGGLVLAGAALYLRPRGVSLTSGRSALVFWLLVLLLHVGAAPVEAADLDARQLLLILPWGLATGLACLASAAPIRRAAARARIGRPRPSAPAAPPPRRSAGAAPERFSPRPPPRASFA